MRDLIRVLLVCVAAQAPTVTGARNPHVDYVCRRGEVPSPTGVPLLVSVHIETDYVLYRQWLQSHLDAYELIFALPVSSALLWQVVSDPSRRTVSLLKLATLTAIKPAFHFLPLYPNYHGITSGTWRVLSADFLSAAAAIAFFHNVLVSHQSSLDFPVDHAAYAILAMGVIVPCLIDPSMSWIHAFAQRLPLRTASVLVFAVATIMTSKRFVMFTQYIAGVVTLIALGLDILLGSIYLFLTD